jgi:choline monooxygenase
MDAPRARSTVPPTPAAEALRREVQRFDPAIPIERAHTPPASWYLDPAFHALERDTVFSHNWIAVGRTAQVEQPGDYLAGDVLGMPFFVLGRDDGSLAAFHNACRHHATELLSGTGCLAEAGASPRITCPYHGWTYGPDGALLTAPHMAGVENFDRDSMGLHAIALDTWNGYVFLHFGENPRPLVDDLAGLTVRLESFSAAPLIHHSTRTYTVRCNWKVFVDNYLDGGYHVPALHPDLASNLDLGSYTTEISERFSIQGCAAKGDRLGTRALYAWIHPNLMLNRYGPVLDVNRVVPVAADRTEVVFDFFFEEQALADAAYVRSCVRQSEQVQQEDIDVSESVQRGLRSPAYDRGRYAPRVETAEHHFHCLLAEEMFHGSAPIVE